jgi:GTP-binding protein Era
MTDDHDDGSTPGAGSEAGPRFGFVAIIGAPNAGKSTLTNALVGAKVTIVSHKVQTTRMAIRGIAVVDRSQLVFVDTPGIFEPKRRLDTAMVDAAWGGAGAADVVVFLIDAARGLCEDAERILDRLGDVDAVKVLVLNKVDRLREKDALLALAGAVCARQAFDKVFMVSAVEGDGIGDLKSYLAEAVPEGVWHYPEDDISDLPMRLLAAEITREKIFHRLHDELPYATTVEPSAWKELRDGSVRIEQTIFVERESQKKIVLGKGGATIKAISSEARREIGAILERPVHLFLFVKVRERWGDDPARYRELGLDYPKSN